MTPGKKEEEVKTVAIKNPEFIEPAPMVKQPEVPTAEIFGEDVKTQARVYPQIRVGVCEFHGTPYGVVNKDTLKGKCRHVCATDPLCPHSKTGCFKDEQGRDTRKPILEKGLDEDMVVVGYENFCRHEHNYDGLVVRCSYCPENADFRGIIKKRTFYVYGHPDNPNRLILLCSDYRCVSAHHKRFSKKAV